MDSIVMASNGTLYSVSVLYLLILTIQRIPLDLINGLHNKTSVLINLLNGTLSEWWIQVLLGYKINYYTSFCSFFLCWSQRKKTLPSPAIPTRLSSDTKINIMNFFYEMSNKDIYIILCINICFFYTIQLSGVNFF